MNLEWNEDFFYYLIELGHDLPPDTAPVIQTVLGGKDWENSREFFRDGMAKASCRLALPLAVFLSLR